MLKVLTVWAILIAATAMEASGDAVVRIGLFQKSGVLRGTTLAAGAVLLFGYGVAVNLTRLPFERVVGLYIATLFLVWQVVSYFTFRSIPRTPVLVGGTLIIIGGLLVTFWSGAPTADLAKPADAAVAAPTPM
jgi:small multidrug resistance family-3 protein